MDGLIIGQKIISELIDIQEVNKRIYPVIANEETNYPFILYQRNSLSPQMVKWGVYEDSITLEINILAESYKESIDIALQVRNKLVTSQTLDCQLLDASESFADVYIQTLTFQVSE